MTTYNELCAALLNEMPRREAIDRMLRELPTKMARAISDYLGAPAGTVGLYHDVIDQAGHWTRRPCEGDCLQTDIDGMYEFCVGISTALKNVRDTQTYEIAMKFSIMYFRFSIEEFDEKSIELKIKNLAGSIPIANAHDAASYADAAKLTIQRLMDDLKNPKPMRGSQSPIGFGH